MNNYFEKQFQIRYFELNKFGEASSTTILTLLEETAADHCYSINYDLLDLEKQNIGWVLLSGCMEMYRYPKYKEIITIKTWLSSYSTIRGYRENIIYDESGEIIGKARGLWLFYDIKKRRPIPILNKIIEQWGFINEECCNTNIISKLNIIENSENNKVFNVNNYDVDTNNHVNNIRYLHWLLESMPDEVIQNYFLHSINGRFIGEANFGDTIYSFTEKEESTNIYLHTIKNQDNKICATAKTIWQER